MFDDRRHAGRLLAVTIRERLGPLEGAVVLGLPRGGVVVADEVATALGLPLDFVGVRKVGAPAHPEFAVGAIAEGGARVRDEETTRLLRVSPSEWDEVERAEHRELARRIARYRAGRPGPDLRGRAVVIVDDGIATGATALASCRSVRSQGAARIVVAAPVAPASWRDGALGREADHLIAVEESQHLDSVGRFYLDFGQTSDDEVVAALESRHA